MITRKLNCPYNKIKNNLEVTFERDVTPTMSELLCDPCDDRSSCSVPFISISAEDILVFHLTKIKRLKTGNGWNWTNWGGELTIVYHHGNATDKRKCCRFFFEYLVNNLLMHGAIVSVNFTMSHLLNCDNLLPQTSVVSIHATFNDKTLRSVFIVNNFILR